MASGMKEFLYIKGGKSPSFVISFSLLSGIPLPVYVKITIESIIKYKAKNKTLFLVEKTKILYEKMLVIL